MILEPPTLDSSLITKAVSALIRHHEKTKPDNDILDSPEPIHVQIVLQTIPKRRPAKPMQITVPHSIHRKDEADICLFVKQSDVKELTKIYQGNFGIKTVMGLETLRKNHASYADRRSLMKTYSVFLADDRIVTMVPSVLGREVWNKPPLPVRVHSAKAIERAVYQSTYLSLSRGTTCTVRAGDSGQPISDLVENVEAIVQTTWKKLAEQHSLKLKLVAVQLPTSVALPILNIMPTELIVTKDINEGKEQKPKKTKTSTKKSPLLEALKAQKESVGAEADSPERKRKTTADDDNNSAAESGTKKQKKPTNPANESEPTKSKRKKNKKDSSKVVKSEEPEATAAKPIKSKKETSTKKEKLSKKTKSEEVPAKSAKKLKPEKNPDKTSESDKAVMSETKTFIAAKSFAGPKTGYVYKKAGQGLGYYQDDKAVVDKMKLAALLRMASNNRRNSGRQRSKSSGRRRK